MEKHSFSDQQRRQLKLSLIGYGKMGQLIERIAIENHHSIISKMGSTGFASEQLQGADLCIDFSHPDAFLDNLLKIAKAKKNVVVGTTGWYEQLPEVEKIVRTHQIGLLYSPNFSIGVNLFFQIVQQTAKLVSRFEQYDAALFEAHHRHKADSPSGTAKALTELLLKELPKKSSATHHPAPHKVDPQLLQVATLRVGSIPGTHSVLFDAPEDTIELTHTARNREGFARGAVAAAEWLYGRTGIFTIHDMLQEY